MYVRRNCRWAIMHVRSDRDELLCMFEETVDEPLCTWEEMIVMSNYGCAKKLSMSRYVREK
jgi:hypothetical protein